MDEMLILHLMFVQDERIVAEWAVSSQLQNRLQLLSESGGESNGSHSSGVVPKEMSFPPRKRQRLSPDPKDYPFVSFGKPLPPLDPEIRDDGTFVPLWKQEVYLDNRSVNLRFATKKEGNDFTEHLQADFQLGISILWVQKKVFTSAFNRS